MVYYHPGLRIGGMAPQAANQFHQAVRPYITPPRALLGQRAVRGPIADINNAAMGIGNINANMGMPAFSPVGPRAGQQQQQQQALQAPADFAQVLQNAGNPFANQGALQAPGPLGALQDSFAAGNQAQGPRGMPAMAPGLQPNQQADLGNPLGPPVAPMGPGGSLGLMGPNRPRAGASNLLNSVNLFNQQPISAYPPKGNRRPRTY